MKLKGFLIWACLAFSIPFSSLLFAQASEVENAIVLDSEQERRFQALAHELRCLVCQNQSIAESNAELASDLRIQTRSMLRDGASDNEIREYMTARYGDFVLYRPPVKPSTYVLWFGPGLILMIAIFIAWRTIAGSQKDDPTDTP